MLGIRAHQAVIPDALIAKYDVSSEDDGRFASMLTPEIVSFFLNNEGVSAEVHSGTLLITPSLRSDPKNYEPAIQCAHGFAQLVGMNATKPEGETTSF